LTSLQKSEADVQRELKDMLRLQQDALDRTTAAEKQRRQTGTLRPDDLERLVQAEQLQQQLRARLGNDREGLRAEVDRVRGPMRGHWPATSRRRAGTGPTWKRRVCWESRSTSFRRSSGSSSNGRPSGSRRWPTGRATCSAR